MDLILTTYQTDYPVLDLGGRFSGVLTRQRLIHALRELGPDTRVVEVMAPSSDIPEVSAWYRLGDSLGNDVTAGQPHRRRARRGAVPGHYHQRRH